MIRPASTLALAIFLALAACQAESDAEGDVPTAAEGDRAPISRSPVADDGNDGSPDFATPPLTSEAEREKGARSVLLAFARAVELKDFDQAHLMFGDTGGSDWSRRALVNLFGDLDGITVAVPEGTLGGAAGSSYYVAPATITAKGADGRSVRYEGEIVLRRVNDVPGATADELRWRIERVALD